MIAPQEYPDSLGIEKPSRRAGRGKVVGNKQVALFCHLAELLIKLSNRISWRKLDRADVERLHAVSHTVNRALETARAARKRHDL